MEVNFSCICKECSHQEKEKVSIEINFSDGTIYWYCPNCSTVNSIKTRVEATPLPKIRGLRGLRR